LLDKPNEGMGGRGQTLYFDRWRVAAGLHDAAEEDGDVAVDECQSLLFAHIEQSMGGVRDVALLEYWGVLEQVIRQVCNKP
jgi:hypothetical protein